MRKERYVTITADTRDKGKRFLITEMPAYDLEWFYARALMALGTSGISVPQHLVDMGAIGIALLSYQVFLGASPEAIRPLKDEMMQRCVQFAPPDIEIAMGWDPSVIFEVSTLKTLREAVLELHTGFTLAALAHELQTMAAMKKASLDSLSQTTSTSPEQSAS